jgi:hypothetical protein
LTQFCHIVPTDFVDMVKDYNVHLVLAHLIEQDPVYAEFYYNLRKSNPDATIIMDNSAFELYKQGLPMYPAEKLISMATKVAADYIVMPDYPGELAQKTINAAIKWAPIIKEAGFKTFFVPQGIVGSVNDLLYGFEWAANNPDLIDYVGVSILSVPNAYGVEKDNKLQRYLSRYKFVTDNIDVIHHIKAQGTKIHFLGMVDGPNEIELMSNLLRYIDTWDSSAAVWAGINGISFDASPTGLINGKFEKHVDFSIKRIDIDDNSVNKALSNIGYIDRLIYDYNVFVGELYGN